MNNDKQIAFTEPSFQAFQKNL